MRQMAPFLNSSGAFAPMRRAANSPRFGSWPTSAMRAFFMWHASSCMTAAGVPAGASASLVLTGGRGFKPFGKHVGRLLRAHQRAGDDVIEADTERVEPLHFLGKPA